MILTSGQHNHPPPVPHPEQVVPSAVSPSCQEIWGMKKKKDKKIKDWQQNQAYISQNQEPTRNKPVSDWAPRWRVGNPEDSTSLELRWTPEEPHAGSFSANFNKLVMICRGKCFAHIFLQEYSVCEPVCHMNFRKWCRKCDLWEGKIRTFVDIWWLSHIPNPRYSFSPMLNTFAHKSGKRTSGEMGPFRLRAVNCFSFCAVNAKQKRWDEKLKNTVSKLLWELFVRPWDLLVPQLRRKTHKQTMYMGSKTNKQSTWDLWEPLSGRLLGLGRPRPVVKAP